MLNTRNALRNKQTIQRSARSIAVPPPAVSEHYIELPQSTLHYVTCGDGPPLIMVPATISRIENWLSLAQFMGRHFTVHFFELPGHGGSTPFSEPFRTDLVAETVESFVDALGYDKVSLMGFSFGGILTMKSLYRLQERVEKVVLIAPALSKHAVTFSGAQRTAVRMLIRTMRSAKVRTTLLSLVNNPHVSAILAAAIRKVGNVEENIPMEQVFKKVDAATCEVLSYQLSEIINLELPRQSEPFSQPCYFAMSANDPMLDFDVTLATAHQQFQTVHVERFDFPYHQPPQPFTYPQLIADFSHLLEQIENS